MTKSLIIAKLYFELSNNSDFDGISKLLTESTTYSSQNTGVYLGVKDILEMQRAYHGRFKSLYWRVNSVKEVKSGIILFDYDFIGTQNDGQEVESSGLEYVIVMKEKILHIETRNKN